MIKKKILISQSTSPFYNLAVEKYLTTHVEKDEVILFLWKNADTVVVGRNQNVWQECRVTEFFMSGGTIARRLSGGGAVYHDEGNLNFSFVSAEGTWSTQEGLSVIADACRRVGIDATVSGRNDVLAAGAKFSGNAFYSLKSYGGVTGVCHHGCILISTDTERLSRFLSVSKKKLESKGVKSVRSRVVNLSELSKGLTAEVFAEELKKAFSVGDAAEPYGFKWEYDSEEQIRHDYEYFKNDSWIFNRKIDFTDSFGGRFGWGEIQLNFRVSAGTVVECGVYSDAMDTDFPHLIEEAFSGQPFSAERLSARLPADRPESADVKSLLYENI